MIYRLVLLRDMIGLPILEFFKRVIIKAFIVTVIAFIPPFLFHHYMDSSNIFRLLLVGSISIIVSLSTIYIFGLNKQEADYIKHKIKQRIKK